MLVLPRAVGDARPHTLAEAVEQEQAAGFDLGAFHRQWLIQNRAPAVVREQLALGRRHPHLQMVRQGFEAFVAGDPATAAFATIGASSGSELNMLGATQAIINQFCAIPANDAVAGRTYRIQLNGTHSLFSNTVTIIFTPRWGSSTTPGTNITLGPSNAFNWTGAVTTQPYLITFDFTIRTAPPGATTGTGIGFGTAILGVALTGNTIGVSIPMGGTAATIDTTGQGTAGCGLTMNLTYGTSNASNGATCLQCLPVRSLN